MIMSYTRRAFRGASISLVFAILASLVAYGTRVLLARNLSLQEYGLFYAVFNFVIFFLFFRDLGLGQALVKYIAEYRAKNNSESVSSLVFIVVLFQTISSLIFAYLFWFFSGYLEMSYFKYEGAALILKFLTIYVVFSIFFIIAKNIFQGFQRMALYASVEFVKNVLVFGLTVFFFWYGFTLFSPVFAFAILCPLLFIYSPFVLITHNFFKTKISNLKTHTKELFSFGIPVFATSVGGKIIAYLDTLFLTYYVSLAEVGIYNVVLPSALIFLFFSKAITSILFPLSSELWTLGDSNRLTQGIMLLHKYVFIIMVPLITPVILYGHLFIDLLFGSNYSTGALSFRILLIGVPFYVVASLNNSVLSGIGKPKKVALIILSSALLNIILNIFLIPLWGINGAAIATSLSYLFMLILSTIILRKNVLQRTPWKIWLSLLPSIFITLIVGYTLQNITPTSIFNTLFVSLVSIGTFVISLFVFRIINLNELVQYMKRI